jgi:hypothetical protein|tara:strand:- start:49 stop:306 length:258 start_codon:yes stop_codon:yes gene_type:complete
MPKSQPTPSPPQTKAHSGAPSAQLGCFGGSVVAAGYMSTKRCATFHGVCGRRKPAAMKNGRFSPYSRSCLAARSVRMVQLASLPS